MSEQTVDQPLDPFADPAASTARPEPVESSAETADQRARRCRFHKLCTCSHTECRDGFLDVDEPDPIPTDPHHVRNRRCRRCHDAQVMHFELNDMRGKRGRRP